ncbi:MAG: chorismate synthase [Actinobacteria bacterium]|nr:chorismate synthase [Actinomycetota bacterium]
MRFLSSGESHGKALAGIIDDFPSGVNIDIDFINNELKRRQSGYGRGKRMDIEKDKIEIISGIRHGKTSGSPISFLISNKDWENWKEKMSLEAKQINENDFEESAILNPRPGHADFGGFIKYRLNDIRDVIERSSARETAIRVAAGGFAKILLKAFDIYVYSFVEQIGQIKLNYEIAQNKLDENLFFLAENSDVRCPDEEISNKMKNEINTAIKNKDTIGGKFTLFVKGLPIGLGSYSQWDRRLDAKIAHAIISIPAIKAVEIGNGVLSSSLSGTNFHDEIFYNKKNGFYRKTNNCGGLEGGVTNGEDLIISAYMKPIPTTMTGLKTVNIKTKENEISLKERSDVCAVPAASVVGEAMLAIILCDALQDKFGRDNLSEILENFENYKKYIKNI